MALFGPPNIAELVEKNDVKGLVKALHNKDLVIRKDAAEALFKIGDPSSNEGFIDALKDEDAGIRRLAAHALGNFGDMQAIYPLIDALSDSDEQTRQNAAWALGNVGNEIAEEPLKELLLRKKDDDLMQIAAESLSKLKAYRALVSVLRNSVSRGHVMDVLAQGGDRAVDPLVQALKDTNGEIRMIAAQVLGRIGSERALEPLRATLEIETFPAAREELEKSLKALGG